ncbi:MAG TPA: hypothetical protein VGE79_15170 [Niastella sp.]
MAAAIVFGLILLAVLLLGVVGFILYLLYFAIIYRHRPLKAILAGILAVCLIGGGLFLYLRTNKADPKILGDYKLNKLDGWKCENCKVNLREDYTYDIIVNNQVVGNGKWETKTAIDIPGEFLEIENGPSSIHWEENRLIEEINRIPNWLKR